MVHKKNTSLQHVELNREAGQLPLEGSGSKAGQPEKCRLTSLMTPDIVVVRTELRKLLIDGSKMSKSPEISVIQICQRDQVRTSGVSKVSEAISCSRRRFCYPLEFLLHVSTS